MSLGIIVMAAVPTVVAAVGWATTSRRLARVRAQLHSDPLTGLANRLELADRVHEARRGQGSVALLMLDLDDFKPINDTYGHDEGNRVLRHVADRLHATADEDELPVRLHGDEFAMLLVGLPPGAAGRAVAAQRIEAVRRAIAEPLTTQLARHAIRASIGASVLPAERAELSALLSQADASLYRDKPHRPHRRAAPTSSRSKRADLRGKAISGMSVVQPVMAGARPSAAGAVNQSWLGRTSEFRACSPLPHARGMDRSKERGKGPRP